MFACHYRKIMMNWEIRKQPAVKFDNETGHICCFSSENKSMELLQSINRYCRLAIYLRAFAQFRQLSLLTFHFERRFFRSAFFLYALFENNTLRQWALHPQPPTPRRVSGLAGAPNETHESIRK
jgi:hypothetical protein